MKRIDHILIKADNLHGAVQEFSDAGFRVFYGTRKGKAYNALIYLQDHSFLELVRTTVIPPFARTLTKWGVFRTLSPFFNRIGSYYFKGGPILDYSVYSPDIDLFYDRVKKNAEKPKHLKRLKPNGVTVRWKLLAPKNLHFPFLMSDYEPEKMSHDETYVHPNGVEGIQRLAVGVADDLEVFQNKLITFFNIENEKVIATQVGFDIKTDNASVGYLTSDQNKINQIVLHPFSEIVNNKLGKYGLITNS